MVETIGSSIREVRRPKVHLRTGVKYVWEMAEYLIVGGTSSVPVHV